MAAKARVNTRRVEGRRGVSYGTVDDVLADIDRVERAAAEGRLRALGNWSPGQLMQHLAKGIEFSFDGYPMRAPLLLRALGPVLRGLALKMRMRPGITLPAEAAALLPDDEVSLQEGAERFRRAMKRIKSGEKMTARSPVLGTMTHGQWLMLHLRHGEMHMSFLEIGGGG